VKYCISACNFAILWELPQLENGSGRGTSAAQQQKQLRDHLDAYIPLMTELIVTSSFAIYREEVSNSFAEDLRSVHVIPCAVARHTMRRCASFAIFRIIYNLDIEMSTSTDFDQWFFKNIMWLI